SHVGGRPQHSVPTRKAEFIERTTTGAVCIRHSATDRRRSLRSNQKIEAKRIGKCALSGAANETVFPLFCLNTGFTLTVCSSGDTRCTKTVPKPYPIVISRLTSSE